ncbi:hypothetical protein ACWD0J_10375 [Streptomyces sp. NPDC003011]
MRSSPDSAAYHHDHEHGRYGLAVWEKDSVTARGYTTAAELSADIDRYAGIDQDTEEDWPPTAESGSSTPSGPRLWRGHPCTAEGL